MFKIFDEYFSPSLYGLIPLSVADFLSLPSPEHLCFGSFILTKSSIVLLGLNCEFIRFLLTLSVSINSLESRNHKNYGQYGIKGSRSVKEAFQAVFIRNER